MSKDLWIEAHERLIADYMDKHPKADWSRAYDATAPLVDESMVDDIAAKIDELRDRRKYE